MSKVFIEESTLTAIGDSIRDKTGKKDLISPLNMPTEIKNIKGGNIIKTVSGICPITLENCAEGNLLDYKIYGAEGGVGDLENLFDKHYNTGYVGTAPNVATTTDGLSTEWYELNNIGLDFTLALNPSEATTSIVAGYIQSNDKSTIDLRRGFINANKFTINVDNFANFTVSTTQYKYIKFYVLNAAKVNDIRIYKGLNNNLTTPYGFWFPLKVNETEYRLLLDINNSLHDGDYLDFENRKVVIGGVTTMVELPKIALSEGTNTFNVDTTVKPSNVSLTYVKSIEFNIMKTIEGTLPLTVAGVGQRLEDYKIYGAYGDALYYGDANEYIGYDYITTNQGSGSNKAGFNSGIKWNEVNKFRFSIRNNTTQENNMIFAAKATNENVGSALVSPWIGLGQVKYQSNGITSLTYANHPDPGVFGVDTLTFATPTSTNYIWVASWMDSAWSRNNDWGFVEFYKDDTLVAAFYPAKRVSDGVFGFYNKVSRDFITCGASESAFVGHAELSNSVGELLGNYYIIPINIIGNITNIESSARLGANDYIDFENRKVVIGGVSTHIDLPEIYLQNGQNIIDVDTTVKPSKMSVSFVDDVFDPSQIITKSTEISCENTGTLYNSACEQVIKSPIITNPTGTHLYHWNQLNDNGYINKSVTQNGVTFTNVGNGKIVLSGTSTNRVLMPVVSTNLMQA